MTAYQLREEIRLIIDCLNAFDMDDGRWLAVKEPALWNAGDMELVADLLEKYKVSPIIVSDRIIDLINDKFWIEFPYDSTVIQLLRTMPDDVREFVREPKKGHWVLLDPRVKNQLLLLIDKFHFTAKPETLKEIHNLHLREIAVRRRRAEIIKPQKEWVLWDFEKNHTINDQIKLVPSTEWYSKELKWKSPLTYATAERTLRIIREYDFEISDSAQKRLDELIQIFHEKKEEIDKEEAERNRKAEELFLLSRAEDADITVPRLNGKLRPFQRAGIKYMLEVERGFNNDQPGLGKSLQLLAAVELADAHPSLIICPKSLKANWRDEINKWFPHRTSKIINGKGANIYDTDFTIINYDILQAHESALLKIPFQSIGFDEFHLHIKNSKTKRAKSLVKIAKDKKYIWGLTGTPIKNTAADMIHPLRIIGRINDFGGSKAFHQSYVNGAETQEFISLHTKLRSTCVIRRTKEQVLPELPAKTYSYLRMEIDNRKDYQEAEDYLNKWLTDKAFADQEFLSLISDLSDEDKEEAKKNRAREVDEKVLRAKQLLLINECRQIAARGKLTRAIEWIEDFLEGDQKLVVFAHHREILNTLIKRFPGCGSILGGQKEESIQEDKRRFQEDVGCKLMVVSILAGGTGHTLTAASNAVFLEFPWCASDLDQCCDRLHRLGQHDNVMIWSILGENTIDEWMMEIIEEKRMIAEQCLDGTSDFIKNTNIMQDLVTRILRK